MSTTVEQVKGGSFLLTPIGAMPQFTPEDFGDDAKEFARAAKDFIQGEVVPQDEAIDKLDLPLTVSLMKKAGDLGLLGLEIPEAYEGMDVDKRTAMLVLEEMSKQGSFAVSYSANTGIGTLPIVYFGTEAQKQTYLPKLASGEWLAAYALTEAGSGSDALGAKATAVLDGDSWVLNGTKMWITNAGFADVFVIFAKVDGQQFSAFIVEKTDPGISTGAEEKKLGIKGSSTRTVILENCRIPKDRLLGDIGKGHKIAFGILNIGRFKLGVGSQGGMKRILEYAIRYTSERQQFNKPINSFGLIQQKLADMATKIFVCEALNFRTVGYIDEALHGTSWDSPTAGADKMAAIDEYTIECSIS